MENIKNNADLEQHNLEAFSQNLKDLDQAYKEENALSSDIPYLGIDGLEGILNHGIFGTQEPNSDSLSLQNLSTDSTETKKDKISIDDTSKREKKVARCVSNQEKRHKCIYCSFATHNRYNLDNHMLRHADPSTCKVYTCPECPYNSVIKRNVDRHAKKHKSPNNILKCSECPYETVQCHEFRRHRYTHFQVTLGSGILLKNAMQGINLIKKDSVDITEPVLQCDECLYTCNKVKYLKKHKLNRHQQDKTLHKCELCEFRTSNGKYLDNHKKNVHSNSIVKMHACQKCSFTSKYRTCLLKHQKLHLGEEGKATIFYCFNCTFQTIHKGSLIKHMPLHKEVGDKPMLQCKMCLFETKEKGMLKRHEAVHSNKKKVYKPKTYECKKCGVRYSLRRDWYKHKYNDCETVGGDSLIPKIELVVVEEKKRI